MAYGIVIIVVFGLLIVVPLIIAAITQEKSVLKLAGALLGILFALVAVVSYAGIWGIAAFSKSAACFPAAMLSVPM